MDIHFIYSSSNEIVTTKLNFMCVSVAVHNHHCRWACSWTQVDLQLQSSRSEIWQGKQPLIYFNLLIYFILLLSCWLTTWLIDGRETKKFPVGGFSLLVYSQIYVSCMVEQEAFMRFLFSEPASALLDTSCFCWTSAVATLYLYFLTVIMFTGWTPVPAWVCWDKH